MSTALVIGASRGIGIELARQLAARGDTVIATCRGRDGALDALGVRVIDGVDVTDDAAVARLVDALRDTPPDIVIHNAGVLEGDHFESLSLESMRRQFEVNALGPLRTVRALAPILREGARVGLVSSRVGSIDDNGSGNNYGYRTSKAAVNMIGKNLSHDLAPRGVAIALLHPGLVATDMTGGRGIEPAVAAAGLIARMDELDLAKTGTFWHAEGYALPW